MRTIRSRERDRAFDRAAVIQNANLTRAKARTAHGVINRLLFIQEHRLNAWAFVHLPDVPKMV
jgi:hypothetical protein